MKKAIAVLFAALIAVSLIACGSESKGESDPDTYESTSEITTEPVSDNSSPTEDSYREFNVHDYSNMNFLIIPLESMSGEKIREVQDWFYNNDDANSKMTVSLMNASIFAGENDEACADMIELGCVGTSLLGAKQYYYKINVKDLERLKQNIERRAYTSPIDTSQWSSQDEIYMLCEYYYPDEEARIDYYFKNYSVSDDSLEQGNTSTDSEMTYADWNTYCTEKTISMEMYDLTVPDSWLNTCAYDISGNGWDITFTLPSGNGGNSDCTLLELHLIWGDYTFDSIPAGNVEYLGALGVQDVAYLVAVYPYELPDTEQAKDIPLVIASITPKEYVIFKRDAYPVGLPDYYVDGFNDADSLIVSNYLCDCTFVGFNSDTLLRVEKNPYGNFFNIDVDGIGYFQVERCTTNYKYPTETYKLYCGNYYAEVICYSGKEYLLVNIMQDDITVLSDWFYFYTP